MVAYGIAYGDSISDATTPTYGSGAWFGNLCSQMGWTRRGGGSSSADISRAAIAGVAIQSGIGVTQHGSTDVATRLAPYLVAGADNYLCIELCTNDYFYASNSVTPTTLGAAIDAMQAAIDAMAVQPVYKFWMGMTNEPTNGIDPVAALPFTWAATAQSAWDQMDAVIQAKCAQYGYTYVNMKDMPRNLMPDNTHPSNAASTSFYTNRAYQVVGAALGAPIPKDDPAWHCGRKQF